MTGRQALAFALLWLAAGPAPADSQGVYESLDEIAIGTVFLSPDERAWLDIRRLQPPPSHTEPLAPSGEPQAAKPAARPAAGYIIASDGRQKRWSDSGFISTGDASLPAMRFPGDIRIERHPPKSAASTPESRATRTAPEAAEKDGETSE